MVEQPEQKWKWLHTFFIVIDINSDHNWKSFINIDTFPESMSYLQHSHLCSENLSLRSLCFSASVLGTDNYFTMLWILFAMVDHRLTRKTFSSEFWTKLVCQLFPSLYHKWVFLGQPKGEHFQSWFSWIDWRCELRQQHILRFRLKTACCFTANKTRPVSTNLCLQLSSFMWKRS